MSKMRALIIAFLAMLTIAWITVSLPPVQKSKASDMGPEDSLCGGLLRGDGYNVLPVGNTFSKPGTTAYVNDYTTQGKFCGNSIAYSPQQNLPSFLTAMAFHLNNSQDQTFTIKYKWGEWFCPGGSLDSNGHCKQLHTDTGLQSATITGDQWVWLYSNTTTPASFTNNGLPYGGVCGAYQNDISFSVYDQWGNWKCDEGNVSEVPGQYSQAWGSVCTTNISCPIPTRGVTPTYGPTVTPTNGPTVTPTSVPTVTYGPTVTPTNGPTVTPTTIPSATPTPPYILVIKYVQGDGGKSAKDFTMQVTGTNVSNPSFPGDANGIWVQLDPGQYSVTEDLTKDQAYGYTMTYRSADCSGYITYNQTKTCIIVNTQNGVTPTITPTGTNTNNCNGTNQSGNNGGNNNNNCNQQNQHQEQNQYNNNNQTVNITYSGTSQTTPVVYQPQVLGVSYPSYANSLPSTGPAETWEIVGALTPLGFILRKISKK